LSQRGHTVEMAADGQTALQKLAASEYDLVICDMIMPDILGTELYERAAEKYPALDRRFIFVTGNVVDKDTRLFLEKSRLPWLSKPFLPADIENIVHKTANATLFSTD
jgi:CheY-like chemotaxis protein